MTVRTFMLSREYAKHYKLSKTEKITINHTMKKKPLLKPFKFHVDNFLVYIFTWLRYSVASCSPTTFNIIFYFILFYFILIFQQNLL